MALWANGRLPGRGFVRAAYFTPTMLPMIAAANLWLFFYTPSIGLIDRIAGLFGIGATNWLGQPETALMAVIIVTIWKEAGFFMIFYLAALQTIPPDLREAAIIEGAGRWTYTRRILLPLLMPTTLFILINALINSVKLIDHLFILTKGGPNNASKLILYWIWETAFSFFDRPAAAALTAWCWPCSASSRSSSSAARKADPLPMSAHAAPVPRRGFHLHRATLPTLDAIGAWMLALVWIAPLVFAAWAAFHSPRGALAFDITAPWTLDNFVVAWASAPWPRYFFNTMMLVTTILAGQLVVCTLAGFAFARFEFRGREVLFYLVLLQLFILPEVLIVENYVIASRLGLFDTILGIGAPYIASAFGIFLLRQAFKQVPKELEEAARVEGCGWLGVLWRVYVPAARPVYLAYALVSSPPTGTTSCGRSCHQLDRDAAADGRPVAVRAPESGVNIAVISAGTLMTVGAAAGRLPDLPAPVHPGLPARRGALMMPRGPTSMTVVLTWNIQAGLGCDGVTDLGRIADTIRARDPDIICLQEVAQNVPDLGSGDDQVERLAALFRRLSCRVRGGHRPRR
jgi:sn-glycerol 3-phosphate transport system permease protein